jgi:glutamine amidotransferase
MCRWMAYSGSPVPLADLLLRPTHSLIDQSLHSRMGAETTNGDGFGIGWYGVGDTPGTFHSTEPAWNDRNLADLAEHLVSPLVLAHVRAATGGPIQQTNCHPFRYQNRLFMHNGLIRDFARVKRELAFAVDPSLYHLIEGSTDSEVFFYLALTMGLEDDPIDAVEKAVGFIEHTGHEAGVQHPIQMTVATTDGASIWAFRYSSEGQSRSLFHSTDVAMLQSMYPENSLLQEVSNDTRLIVSEPLADLPGAWREFPESSCGIVHGGQDEIRPFAPQPPGGAVHRQARIT